MYSPKKHRFQNNVWLSSQNDIWPHCSRGRWFGDYELSIGIWEMLWSSSSATWTTHQRLKKMVMTLHPTQKHSPLTIPQFGYGDLDIPIYNLLDHHQHHLRHRVVNMQTQSYAQDPTPNQSYKTTSTMDTPFTTPTLLELHLTTLPLHIDTTAPTGRSISTQCELPYQWHDYHKPPHPRSSCPATWHNVLMQWNSYFPSSSQLCPQQYHIATFHNPPSPSPSSISYPPQLLNYYCPHKDTSLKLYISLQPIYTNTLSKTYHTFHHW